MAQFNDAGLNLLKSLEGCLSFAKTLLSLPKLHPETGRGASGV